MAQEPVGPLGDLDLQGLADHEVKADCQVHLEEPDNQDHQDHEENRAHRELAAH